MKESEIFYQIRQSFNSECLSGYGNMDFKGKPFDTYVMELFFNLMHTVKDKKIKKNINRVMSFLETYAGSDNRHEIIRSCVEVIRDMEEAMLARPVQYVTGVGPHRSRHFLRKGVNTVRDLLYYNPIRYEDKN